MIMPIPHHNQEGFALRYASVWSPMLLVIVRSNNFSQWMNEPAPPIHLHPDLVLVLLRLWLIRNRNQKFIFSTLILFVIANVATITCVIIVLINTNREYPPSAWHSMNRTMEIIWLMLSINDVWPRTGDVHDDAPEYIRFIIRSCSELSPSSSD